MQTCDFFGHSPFGSRDSLSMSTLTYILGWPLLAAMVLVFVPRNYLVVMRAIAYAAPLVSALLGAKSSRRFRASSGDSQIAQQVARLGPLAITSHVGVD